MLGGMWWKKNTYSFWWECNLMQLLWKSVWRFFKELKINLPHDTAIHARTYTEGLYIMPDTSSSVFTDWMPCIQNTLEMSICWFCKEREGEEFGRYGGEGLGRVGGGKPWSQCNVFFEKITFNLKNCEEMEMPFTRNNWWNVNEGIVQLYNGIILNCLEK